MRNRTDQTAPDWDEGNTQMWVGKPAPSEISDKVEKARVVLGDTIVDMMSMQIEIQRLRAIVRVNGLRWGHSHAEIDAILAGKATSDVE